MAQHASCEVPRMPPVAEQHTSSKVLRMPPLAEVHGMPTMAEQTPLQPSHSSSSHAFFSQSPSLRGQPYVSAPIASMPRAARCHFLFTNKSMGEDVAKEIVDALQSRIAPPFPPVDHVEEELRTMPEVVLQPWDIVRSGRCDVMQEKNRKRP